jgi:hypothetical protein
MVRESDEVLRPKSVLSVEQIQEYLDFGILVVPNILTPQEVSNALQGLSETLLQYGIDANDLEATGHNLASLSSTNGSGGVLDIFYEDWTMYIASHPKLFQVTTELWEKAYCHDGQKKEGLAEYDIFKWHPYGSFNFNRGFMYLDRIGYRLPTALAEKLGSELCSKLGERAGKRKGLRNKSLQRSLTPHLDCCPETFLSENQPKWRPIQCFVSLTTNLEHNTGGFEAAPGFQREFETWACNRPPGHIMKEVNGMKTKTAIPAPCVGQYTHIRPVEDAWIMQRVKHIPVPAGAAVFWDNRIPHANSYRNDSSEPRVVVYTSFLPDVAINHHFVENQKLKYLNNVNPCDQWIDADKATKKSIDSQKDVTALSILCRKLLGLEDW